MKRKQRATRFKHSPKAVQYGRSKAMATVEQVENAKAFKRANPKPDQNGNKAASPAKTKKGKSAKTAPPPRKGRGRRKLVETMTPAEIAAEIKEFLTDLRDSTDPDEKKRIRRALRLRGHTGGLGDDAKPKAKKAKRAPAPAIVTDAQKAA